MDNHNLFHFHHIGLACKNIEKEIVSHEKLNYVKETDFFIDPNQKIKGIFMVNGAFRLELLEATEKESPINNYLKKGIRMYHQCFTTPNLDKAIEFLQNEGAIVVVDSIEAVAFNNRKIAFLYLRTHMLVELIEE